MNPFTGALSQTGFEHPHPVKGGILCDGERTAELCIGLWLKLSLLLHRHAVCALLGVSASAAHLLSGQDLL